MESPRMVPAALYGDLEEFISALDPKSLLELDLARLRGVLENVQIHGFQRRHYGRLEELLKRLQSFSRPEILVTEEFFGALAKLYDNLVTGDFTRREVLSLNLQLLFVIEDLSDHPQGKVLCGKHFITRLLSLVCAKSGSLKLKRASVETLCALVTRSTENQKFLILHVTGCYKLFKVFLPKCGDFQLQASAAEILFRLTRKHNRLIDIIDDNAAKKAMLTMHEVKKPDVRTGIRNFVNLVNESLGASRSVHSFRALQVFIDGNEHVSHEEVWVHIGLDHVSYYTNTLSKEFEGAAEIMDFDFKNIKEIKVLHASSLELVIWKPQDNAAVPTRTIARFRFSSEDAMFAYQCCMARLSSLKATVPQSSSQLPWTGKASIGIAVPLPRITDFPIMPSSAELSTDKPTRDVLVPTAMDLRSENVNNVIPCLDTDKNIAEAAADLKSDDLKVLHSPEVPSHHPEEIEGKENVGHLRSKLKAMLEGPTKKAIEKLKVVQEKSPSNQQENILASPCVMVHELIGNGVPHHSEDLSFQDGSSIADQARCQKQKTERSRPNQKTSRVQRQVQAPIQTRASGRPRKKTAPEKQETEDVELRTRRRRHTLAELTSGIEVVNAAAETKRPKFEKDNSVTPESPIHDPCDDMDGVVVLFANMLNKFKKKLQSRVRDKTVHILSSTSEAIKSEASTVELQIKRDTDDYAQQCKDKLGRIELDLHDKCKSFKKLCEDFDNLFKHHCEQLEQIQTQMDCTDDELSALSEKRKLTHRKLIAQMQKRGEELLSEAESKILAVRKAAKHMQGFKEILQQLVMDTVEI